MYNHIIDTWGSLIQSVKLILEPITFKVLRALLCAWSQSPNLLKITDMRHPHQGENEWVLPVFTIAFLFRLLQANSQPPDLTLVPAQSLKVKVKVHTIKVQWPFFFQDKPNQYVFFPSILSGVNIVLRKFSSVSLSLSVNTMWHLAPLSVCTQA